MESQQKWWRRASLLVFCGMLLSACGNFDQYRNIGADLVFQDKIMEYSPGDPAFLQRQVDLTQLWELAQKRGESIPYIDTEGNPRVVASLNELLDEDFRLESIKADSVVKELKNSTTPGFSARLESWEDLYSEYSEITTQKTEKTLKEYLSANNLPSNEANTLTWISQLSQEGDDKKLYLLGYESLSKLQAGKLILSQVDPDFHVRLYTTHYAYVPLDDDPNRARIDFLGNEGDKAYTVGPLSMINFDTMGYVLKGDSGAAYTAYPRVQDKLFKGKPCYEKNKKVMGANDSNGFWGDATTESGIDGLTMPTLVLLNQFHGIDSPPGLSQKDFDPFAFLESSEGGEFCVEDVKRPDAHSRWRVVVPYVIGSDEFSSRLRPLADRLRQWRNEGGASAVGQLGQALVYSSQALLRYGGMGSTAGNMVQGFAVQWKKADVRVGFAATEEPNISGSLAKDQEALFQALPTEVETWPQSVRESANTMWVRGRVEAQLGGGLVNLLFKPENSQKMGYAFGYVNFALFPGVQLHGMVQGDSNKMYGQVELRTEGGESLGKLGYDNLYVKAAFPSSGRLSVELGSSTYDVTYTHLLESNMRAAFSQWAFS